MFIFSEKAKIESDNNLKEIDEKFASTFSGAGIVIQDYTIYKAKADEASLCFKLY